MSVGTGEAEGKRADQADLVLVDSTNVLDRWLSKLAWMESR